MKEEIIYLYNLDNIEMHYDKNNTFIYNGIKYIIIKTNRTDEELNEIYNLTYNNTIYDKLIKTRFNKLTFIHDKNKYVLIKCNHKNINILNYILNNNNSLNTKNSILMHNNWYMLISKKIDYIEYQYTHIKEKYPLIDESINYYIGMAESSLSYLKYIEKTNIKADSIVISHRRLSSMNSFYNPTNLILDSKMRDLSEILKYSFLNNININLEKILLENNYSNYQYGKLISRMLYPSFYFDSYEKIINESHNEECLKSIIERSKEYEIYLYKIIEIINRKIKIKKIEWLKPF